MIEINQANLADGLIDLIDSRINSVIKKNYSSFIQTSDKSFHAVVVAINDNNTVDVQLNKDNTILHSLPNKTGYVLNLNDNVNVIAPNGSLTNGYVGVRYSNTTVSIVGKVVNDNIDDNTISGVKFQDGTITGEKLSVAYATITNLNAEKARIDTLEANSITTDYLESNYATITNLNAQVARIDTLESNQITTDYLTANYADIDLANIATGAIKTAMIDTGAVGTAQIADGSITDAKIVGLTANKITAGTIDAADIEVVNLNAANITVGTINGQQIAPGAIDTSKLTSSLNDTINSAASDANNALTAANGKSTNYYGTETPSNPAKNDIWFKDDGNGNITPMQYNGADWISRIDAVAISAKTAIDNKQWQTDIDTAVSGLSGSGRNLILESNLSTLHTYPGDFRAAEQADGWLRITLDNDFSEILTNDVYNVTVGADYTESVYFRTDASSVSFRFSFYDSTTGHHHVQANIQDMGDGTYRATSTGKFYGSSARVPDIAVFSHDGGSYIDFYHFKLEQGPIATGWSPAPEDTQSQISTLQSSVDNKNTIYYSDSQPSGGTYKVNDTWFDTNDGNKIYQYNGSSWVAKQFGTNAIANLSITNALIANGTIQSAKIGSVDAGSITTGFLSANRINANTITGTMIASHTINADNLVAGSLTSASGVFGTIDAGILTTGTLSADRIGAGTITGAKIAGQTIKADNIASGAITAAKISAGTITATQIASRTITADRIVAGAITANEIAAHTITANQIAANTITAAQIQAGTITADKINVSNLVSALNVSTNTLYAQAMTNTETINGTHQNAEIYGKIGTFTGSNYGVTGRQTGYELLMCKNYYDAVVAYVNGEGSVSDDFPVPIIDPENDIPTLTFLSGFYGDDTAFGNYIKSPGFLKFEYDEPGTGNTIGYLEIYDETRLGNQCGGISIKEGGLGGFCITNPYDDNDYYLSNMDQYPGTKNTYWGSCVWGHNPNNNSNWGSIPVVKANDGVMEIGKAIDFHMANDNSLDYQARIECNTYGGVVFSGSVEATGYYNATLGAWMLASGSYSNLFDGNNVMNIIFQNGTSKYISYSGSDERFKSNVTDSTVDCLGELRQFKQYAFDYSEGNGYTVHHRIGLIAQQVQKIDAEMVRVFMTRDGIDYFAPDYDRINPLMIGAIQQLAGISDTHESRIAALEAENAALQARVSALEAAAK